MAGNLAALRSKVERELTERVSSPFTFRERKDTETVPAGIPEIDNLTGGLPRGGLTEICGPDCSGRTSLLVSALAARTAHAEACALIDGRDAFDPYSAAAAGVELKRLLWVRCRDIEQTLRATDVVLHGGGFGLIAVDLSDLPEKAVRYVPLHAWFRFRRAVENTPTILLLLEREAHAKTCASLVLQLGAERAVWTATFAAETADFLRHPSACLLDEFGGNAEVIRSRVERAAGTVLPYALGRAERPGVFKTRPAWSLPGNL